MRNLLLAILSVFTPWIALANDSLLYHTDFSRLSPGAFGEHTTPAFPFVASVTV